MKLTNVVFANVYVDYSTVVAGRRHPPLEERGSSWERPGLSGGGDDLLCSAGSAPQSAHARFWFGLLQWHRPLAHSAAEPVWWLLLHTGSPDHVQV